MPKLWSDRGRRRRRVRLEDTLKRVLRAEESGAACTVEDLAADMGLRLPQVRSLVDRLTADGYLVEGPGDLLLSGAGRRYARRIVRSHRLWERFLADETAVDPSELHPLAEEQEHRLTAEQADALSERLGRPSHDPHGSPIPDSEGRLPAIEPQPVPRLRGTPLSSLGEGESAIVVGISQACRGLTRRRFMDLGLTPGGRVEVEMTAPFGDPRAYRIRETLIALRDEQARWIVVRRERT